MNKKIKFLIKLIISLSLLFLLFGRIDMGEFIHVLKMTNFLILIPLLLYIPALWLSAIRWKIILNDDSKLAELFKVYWISNFFSNFLPTSFGGDIYKVIYMKSKHQASYITSSVVMDRLSGLFGLIILGALSSLFLVAYLPIHFILILIISISLILVGVLYLFHKLNFEKFKLYHQIKRNFFIMLKKAPIKVNLISIIFILLGAVSLWIYFYMFGAVLNFFVLLAIYVVLQIIMAIPIAINGLGTVEFSMVYLFGLVGVNSEISLTVSILARMIMILQASVGGAIYLIQKKNMAIKTS